MLLCRESRFCSTGESSRGAAGPSWEAITSSFFILSGWPVTFSSSHEFHSGEINLIVACLVFFTFPSNKDKVDLLWGLLLQMPTC